jgi:hypothetical protein
MFLKFVPFGYFVFWPELFCYKTFKELLTQKNNIQDDDVNKDAFLAFRKTTLVGEFALLDDRCLGEKIISFDESNNGSNVPES